MTFKNKIVKKGVQAMLREVISPIELTVLTDGRTYGWTKLSVKVASSLKIELVFEIILDCFNKTKKVKHRICNDIGHEHLGDSSLGPRPHIAHYCPL